MKEKLIEKTEDIILSLNQDSVHCKILQLILRMFKRLKPTLKINQFVVTNGFVSIEFFHQNLLEYINIDITKSNIEIRGNGFEILQFYDQNLFEKNYADLIISFFEGKYKILSYIGKGNKKEAYGVIWIKESLTCFNNKKEEVNFIRKAVIREESKDGLNLIESN